MEWAHIASCTEKKGLCTFVYKMWLVCKLSLLEDIYHRFSMPAAEFAKPQCELNTNIALDREQRWRWIEETENGIN